MCVEYDMDDGGIKGWTATESKGFLTWLRMDLRLQESHTMVYRE